MSGGWLKDHKRELLAALAVGGAGALTGGFGLLGAGAEAGAGAAAGGELAGGLGAGAADEVMGGSLLSGYGAGPLAQLGDTVTRQFGNNASGLLKLGKLANLTQKTGLLGQPAPIPPMQMPVHQAPLTQTSGLPSLQQMYGQPTIDDEKRRHLAMLMQQRGIYGG